MKRYKREKAFLEEIRTVPNISLACEKVGLSRNTVYRWCKEDPAFKVRLDEAINTGTESINDLAESKLISYINGVRTVDTHGHEQVDYRLSLRALMYWLDSNKKSYARPRPKDFWETIRDDNRITGITITVANPKKDDSDAVKGS